MSATLELFSSARRPVAYPLGDPQRHRESDSMESKTYLNRATMQAADLEQARETVKEIVAREEMRSASRMLAYQAVGRRVGRSSSWIRRLLGGVDVGLSLATWKAINLAYIAHCERIVRDAETARRRAALVKAEADALGAIMPRVAEAGD